MLNIDPLLLMELRDYLYVAFGFIAFLLSFIAGRLTAPR